MTEEAFNQLQDELKRRGEQIADLEARLKEALAGKVPEERMGTVSTIWMESIVSSKTGEGKVNLRWGNLSAQMSVQEARDHAFAILETAEAAQTDAFLAEYFMGEKNLRPEKVMKLIGRFRHYRERKLDE